MDEQSLLNWFEQIEKRIPPSSPDYSPTRKIDQSEHV